jgi:hypothetical protein
MLTTTRRVLALYVDRATHQWIVRDPDGSFWVVPTGPDAWEHREPFTCADDTDLAPVPGHYKYLLQLPYELE